LSNEYYNKTGSPGFHSDGSSIVIANEYAAIETGFNKLPVMAGSGGQSVWINAGGTRMETKTASSTRIALDVPNTAGLGAAGIWGIGISGNAATATLASTAALATVATTALNGGVTSVNGQTGAVTVSGVGAGVTSINVDGGATGLIATGGPVTSVGTITLSGVLEVASGGTGATDAPGARAVLGVPSVIGTDASGEWAIDITGNAATASNGGVTSVSVDGGAPMTGDVAFSTGGGGGGGGGSVTSVNVSGGSTGLVFTGGAITTSGTIVAGGTLAITAGGTGATSAAAARTALNVPARDGSGATGTAWPIGITGNAATATSATTAGSASTATFATTAGNGGVTSVNGLSGSVTITNIVGNAATATTAANGGVTSVNGSTGAVTVTNISGNAATATTISGVVAIANGGTAASSAAAARTNLAVPSLTGTGASGTWGINVSGNAATASNGGVTSVNTGTGAINFVGAIDVVGGTKAILVSQVGSTITLTRQITASDNSSIHPHSRIEMARRWYEFWKPKFKWLCDIRLGDKVRGQNGAAEVLGIWRNTLMERALWAVNGVACTPGHIFPTPNGWGAPSPKHYIENSHGKKRAVKGMNGVFMTECLIGDPDNIEKLEVGSKVLSADGSWIEIERLEAFNVSGKNKRITMNQEVLALYLDNSDFFYSDGIAVATLA